MTARTITRHRLRAVVEDAVVPAVRAGLTEPQAAALRATAESITAVTFGDYLDNDLTCGCPAVEADLIEADGTAYEGVEQNAIAVFIQLYDAAMALLLGADDGATVQVIG